MRNPQYEFSDYLEMHGYDPIGAGDIIGDALGWLRCQPPAWVHTHTASEWHDAFRQSNVYAEYGLT